MNIAKQNIELSQAATRELQVRFDRIYGAIKCYPINEYARLFAEIAGTKTLAPDVLARAERLGFTIVQIDKFHYVNGRINTPGDVQ